MSEFEVFDAGNDDEPIPPRWNENEWNGWKLEGEYLAFDGYVLELVACVQSSVALDYIIQVSRKTWATDACLTGLVRALDHVLNPQAHLCSCGGDKRISVADVRRLLKRRPPKDEREA